MISKQFKAIFGWPLFFSMFLASCQETDEWVQRQNYGPAQGSTYQVSYIVKPSVDYQLAIDSLLIYVDQGLSAWKPNSSLSRLNRGDTLFLANEALLSTMLDSARALKEQTDGLFDISIGQIVSLWGFHRNASSIPSDSAIELALIASKWENIKKSDDSLYLESNCQLDVNGIAQGYTVDLIADFLNEKGVSHYMIEVGGEVRCKGKNIDGQIWRIGIDRPTNERETDRFMRIVQLNNQALATSGNYRKYVEDPSSGKRFGHSLNPRTGRPTQDVLLSASVVCNNATAADAWGTALMVAGLQRAQEIVESKPELEAYLIYSDRKGDWKEWESEGFPSK